MNRPLALAAALTMAMPAGVSMAASGSYTGNWQVKLTHDVYLNSTGYNGHGPNTRHCISLTDDGNVGWPHSGYAVLDNNTNTSGQFAVIGPTILIYIEAPGSDESIASYVLSSTARNGEIGEHGSYDYIEGGTSYDADKATFGTNNSC